jgi:hypothetical protein
MCYHNEVATSLYNELSQNKRVLETAEKRVKNLSQDIECKEEKKVPELEQGKNGERCNFFLPAHQVRSR